MSSTTKLFYGSPDLLEAEAQVLSVGSCPPSCPPGRPEGSSEGPVLVLDRTIFYPEGGGQPWDLGTIGGVAVKSVTERREPDGTALVLHAMAGPTSASPGDTVRLSVDRARRVDYSQQHSAEHLLGALALRLAGARVISVRFGPERFTIDFDLPSIPDESIAAIEEAAEAAIAEDHPIRYRLCPPEDVSSFPLRRPPPAGEEVLRIVEIEGLDFSPCCGLHLGSTLAMRAIRILGTEKYKGMTRLYFVAGARATADYRALSRAAQVAAKTLGTSEAQLAEAVAREAARRRELEYEIVGLERERAEREAASAPESAALERPRGADDPEGQGGAALVVRRYADRGAASLMVCAKAFADRGFTVLLASGTELTVQALAPSAEAALGARLKPALAEAGGKGGGGPANFRATFADEKSLDLFVAAAETLLRGQPR